MLQVSYINLISTLKKIKSPLLNNDTIINNCVDYLIHENNDKDILISFLVKVLDTIYQSLKEQNILFNRKLKFAYEFIIKDIMDIFESKLIFNHVYGSAEKNINIEKIDEIENNNSNNSNSNNNINNDKNQNNEEIQENININNIDNNITYNEKETENKKGYVFREVVNKGIYDYINKIRFCNSSKNLTSVENISEEIDLDDINDEDIDDNNNNNKKNEKFTITNFDELDDEESSNSIGEIFKQTSEMIKKIKFRNKMNENKNSFNKKILNNIVIEDLKQKKKKEDLNNSEIIKKKSKTMNKFNSK